MGNHFLLGIITTLLISKCVLFKNNNTEIEKVQILYSIPYLHTDDSVAIVKDSSVIYFYKDYVVYGTTFTDLYSVNKNLIYDSLRMSYFVYKQHSKVGYLFKNNLFVSEKKDVDSFLLTRPSGIFLDSLLKDPLKVVDSMIGNKKILKKISLQNIFIDSVNLWLNKSASSKFSFSPKLDSIFSSRTEKIEIYLRKNANPIITEDKYRVVSLSQKKMSIDNKDSLIYILINQVK